MSTRISLAKPALGVLLALAASMALPSAAGAPLPADQPSGNYNIPLWEKGKVPNALGDGPLDTPFLTVSRPPENKRNGGAVIIAPGGSNIMLMYGGEGMDAAERFNEWGVTAFVLTYRLSPRYTDAVRIMEGKRAIQLVRARAAEWKLDPKNVGYAGFSAGSNIGRPIVASSGPGDPAAADPVDRMSSRPDYLVLVYGPGRATPGESLKDFPPTFLVSAAADSGPSIGNAQFFTELTRAGATAEMHIYQKGRHGFGAAYGSTEFGGWMPALENFLRLDGFLPVEN